MDELAASFETSFEVSQYLNNPARTHPRFDQYKCKTNKSTQSERRKQMIDSQKRHRYDYLSHFRQLVEGDDVADDQPDDNDDMDWTDLKLKPPPRTYKNQLMLSEWLVDIPEDLETNWYLVLCPVGKRNLVVTANGRTKSYTKSGVSMSIFPSCLPGGSVQNNCVKRTNFTILDCIFDNIERTFYVLDVLSWGGHPVFDSDAEFRFYWLKSKIEETPELQTVSQFNRHRFVPLPHYQCTPDAIRSALHSPLPFTTKLDGLLFYHKETHYLHGPTPLVGWLKPYMVPEMLNVEVPEQFMNERPAQYTTLDEHVRLCKEDKAKTPDRNAMEVVGKKKSMPRHKHKKQSKQQQLDSGDTMEVVATDGQMEQDEKKSKSRRRHRRRAKNRQSNDTMEVTVGK